jgi:hypothetical protein
LDGIRLVDTCPCDDALADNYSIQGDASTDYQSGTLTGSAIYVKGPVRALGAADYAFVCKN